MSRQVKTTVQQRAAIRYDSNLPSRAFWLGPSETRLAFGEALVITFENFRGDSTIDATLEQVLLVQMGTGLVIQYPPPGEHIESPYFDFAISQSSPPELAPRTPVAGLAAPLATTILTITNQLFKDNNIEDKYFLIVSGAIGGQSRHLWQIDPEVVTRSGE